MKQAHAYKFFICYSNQISIALLMLLFISCKKEVQPPTDATADDARAHLLKGAKPGILVTPGNSIQAAVDVANPGDIIQIQPGIYKEAITVNKPNIKIVGLCKENAAVIIENPGGKEDGISVQADGDGFELYNVTVRNFEENGVILSHADNFVLDHVTAVNNGEYGLFPIFCNGGKVEHCTASGHKDTGIYVGQSSNVSMTNNEAYGNVNGLEIENCSHIVATKNQSYDNVDGILVVLLPGLTVTSSSDITVSQNHVYKNNHENFSEVGGGFEAFVPKGCGILIVGPDNVTVQNNTVQGNNFLGIAVVSTTVLGALGGIPPEAFAGIEPNPDGTKVISNVVNSNGTVQPALPFPASDLLWDGSGTNNCWSRNIFKTSFPQQLPTCN